MALIQCPSCGQLISEEARSCPKCGHIVTTPNTSINQPTTPNFPKPNNYLVWSILSTIFCCVIGGAVAWVYSSKVNKSWNAGRYNEAVNYSQKAKNWIIVSVAVYIILFIIGILKKIQ